MKNNPGKNKAQGAMEYMMSYGWAILVIMGVGSTMWQLGVFNINTGGPPTSTGFSGTIKPHLASCQLRNKNTCPSCDGFSCQFVNNLPNEIRIRAFDVTINGYWCQYQDISDSQEYALYWGVHPNLWTFSVDENTPHGGFACDPTPPYPKNLTCSQYEIPNQFHVLGNGIFFLNTNTNNPNPAYPHCQNFIQGTPNKVHVVFTYDTYVGGVLQTKTESGEITITTTGPSN